MKNYIMPFLIIIAVGVIVVLFFSLWKSIFGSDPQRAAYLHFVHGSAQMKAWGTDNFFTLKSDTVVMEGDEIATSSGAQVIMEFFDGTIMRVDENTSFKLNAIDDESSEPLIEVALTDGAVWFNRLYKGTSDTKLVVNMDVLEVNAGNASVFELENGKSKVVRALNVFDASGLSVDIFSQDLSTVVETENVSVGQQIVFTDKVLDRYWAHNSPSVIAEIADSFKEGAWYLWNLKEDRAPTKFEKQVVNGAEGFKVVPPKEIVDETLPVLDVETGVLDADTTKVEGADTAKPDATVKPTFSAKVAKPSITSVAGGAVPDASGVYQVTARVTTLTGTVAAGATKVFVNGYELKKFKQGDGTWTYYANYDYGFMKEGENTYEIYAMDSDGNKSETLIIKVFYTKQAETTVVPDVSVAPPADETAAPADEAKPPVL